MARRVTCRPEPPPRQTDGKPLSDRDRSWRAIRPQPGEREDVVGDGAIGEDRLGKRAPAERLGTPPAYEEGLRTAHSLDRPMSSVAGS